MAKHYPDISSLIKALLQERATLARYPCRLIFVADFLHYCDLVQALRSVAEERILLSDFCLAEDTVPYIEELQKVLPNHPDQTLLIEGFGEYLRLVEQWHSLTGRAQALLLQEAHTCQRIWLPIFGSRSLLTRAIGSLELRQEDGVYELECAESPEPFHLQVLSAELPTLSSGQSVRGLRNWFKAWEALSVRSGVKLYTQHTSGYRAQVGEVSVRIVTQAFEFLQGQLRKVSGLKEGYGTPEQWLWLAEKITEQTRSLKDALQAILNLHSLRGVEALERCMGEPPEARNSLWLLWLTARLEPEALGDYVGRVLAQSPSVEAIAERIELAIFDEEFETSLAQAQVERRRALRYLMGAQRGSEFWERLQQIESPLEQLGYLSQETKAERRWAIQAVCEGLKLGTSLETLVAAVEPIDPRLVRYLMAREVGSNWRLDGVILEHKVRMMSSGLFTPFQAEDYLGSPWGVPDCEALWQWFCEGSEWAVGLEGLGFEWMDYLHATIKELAPELSWSMQLTRVDRCRVWEGRPKTPRALDIPQLLEGQLRSVAHWAETIVEMARKNGVMTVFAGRIKSAGATNMGLSWEWVVPVVRYELPGRNVGGERLVAPQARGCELLTHEVERSRDGSCELFVSGGSLHSLKGQVGVQGVRAERLSDGRWRLSFGGLQPGRRYALKLFPNGEGEALEETFVVKCRGLEVDEDF